MPPSADQFADPPTSGEPVNTAETSRLSSRPARRLPPGAAPPRQQAPRTATVTSDPRWSRTFPATPGHVGHARAFPGAILASSSVADDARLCLSEIAANALTHSNSRHPGGQFVVEVSISSSRLRVEVHDEGGPWNPTLAHDDASGRGLSLVSALASSWGRAGHEQSGWNVWFEIDYSSKPSSQPEET